MAARRATVIGAGVGGLCAAIDMARAGWEVTLFEGGAAVGGKMRAVETGGVQIDAGPTVFTMSWVFEELFESSGARLRDYVALEPLHILARHAWRGDARLDLFAQREHSAEAIAAFAGPRDARGYLAFCAEAKRMYEVLRAPFLQSSKPNLFSLTARIGPTRIGDLLAIRPFDSMWRALGAHFHDARLRQLFGRYATYCGSSPFEAPATLMLIAHVEQEGVWAVRGGMQRLADALAALAERCGVVIRLNSPVLEIVAKRGRAVGVLTAEGFCGADAIICNADPAALTAGLFGDRIAACLPRSPASNRSLSALTWTLLAKARGFPLVRHNVFFSRDYAQEFAELKTGLPQDPTIYVCAEDRDCGNAARDPERLFVLVNAPPGGDLQRPSEAEIEACQRTVLARLEQNGLTLDAQAMTRTGPAQFNQLFPATGGALYGRATHGWAASFLRPGSRTRLPGLYLAGGGAHPGAGVPIAALSGRLAAQRVLADHASTSPFRRAATRGGTSTRSATTATAG